MGSFIGTVEVPSRPLYSRPNAFLSLKAIEIGALQDVQEGDNL